MKGRLPINGCWFLLVLVGHCWIYSKVQRCPYYLIFFYNPRLWQLPLVTSEGADLQNGAFLKCGAGSEVWTFPHLWGVNFEDTHIIADVSKWILHRAFCLVFLLSRSARALCTSRLCGALNVHAGVGRVITSATLKPSEMPLSFSHTESVLHVICLQPALYICSLWERNCACACVCLSVHVHAWLLVTPNQ